MARNLNGFVVYIINISGNHLECVLQNVLVVSPVKRLNSSVFSSSRFVGIDDAAVMH